MPTVKQKEAIERRFVELSSERYRQDGEMMRPTGTTEGLTWDDLSWEQAAAVLSSSVDWSGFDAHQQVEVSLRVLEADWDVSPTEGVVASNQLEHDRADALELRTEEWFGHHGRLPEPGELERHDAAVRAAWEANPRQGDAPDPEPRVSSWVGEAELREAEGGWLGPDAFAPETMRTNLLVQTYNLSREVGFVGFRREFMDDPAAAREWPDPTDRERGLRGTWDEMGDFASYRDSHADTDLPQLIRHQDALLALRDGPEEAQAEFYRRAVSAGPGGREAANDNVPGGDGMPPGGRALPDAASIEPTGETAGQDRLDVPTVEQPPSLQPGTRQAEPGGYDPAEYARSGRPRSRDRGPSR